jgi:hypothetical protein
VLSNGKIIFNDNRYHREENYYEVSEFCSLISMIAVFMTNNIDEIEN